MVNLEASSDSSHQLRARARQRRTNQERAAQSRSQTLRATCDGRQPAKAVPQATSEQQPPSKSTW
ncbi:uncharacterized protein THITE_2121061 [Thermothielavioides terrestris NRRL 8126]|uniref:Uncharacterized protein n=1 Tax=Thermothielavioides terrestris (strain ATCC 38088 / NRRL 8126) TaxID=578455 RepID=G2RED2_THETT|nr:uncharacterized protein THITE_2121061 [Thermothielavioides terrestris NRRL 8126]AEO70104.1 hypothetical protein THITE_2121061 [Thermothielavioides terrestris NRRL 8126]